MTEIFNEQLVKRIPKSSDYVKKGVYISIALLIIFISMLSTFLFFFIIIIVLLEVAVITFLFHRMNLEYEYIVTNSELDVDKIINMRKRKHLFTVDIKSIIVMTKYNNMNESTEFRSYDKQIDVSSGQITDDTYAFMVIMNKKRTMVIFQPNELVLKSMRIYMAGKLLKS
ncbi:MAG: DUF6106 family protein [Vallitaleaceae bacterium]|jgi:hypothetical protein|nr:DUF6106 family protein [Vallitaleaceae bacterium]